MSLVENLPPTPKNIIILEEKSQGWLQPNFLPPEKSDSLFRHLRYQVPWIRHSLYTGTERQRKQARLSCSMGGSYAYSGSVHPSSPWDPEVKSICDQINQTFNCTFNACLLNYYQNGSEYISAHSDDIRSLDSEGKVASLSLGAEREMVFKNKHEPKTIKVSLPHGSIFMMEGEEFQKNWTHAIPPTSKDVGARISLTFRSFVEAKEKKSKFF
jgi:alkylated DNA repair dioxygenase AlkB